METGRFTEDTEDSARALPYVPGSYEPLPFSDTEGN